MIPTNATFDALHDATDKNLTPMYLVQFDGETDICDHVPLGGTANKWLVSITGSGQKIEPEEGRGTIGGVKVEILDVGEGMTAIVAADTTSRMHRRAVTIKAGYAGMAEADMLTIFANGRVTGHKLSSDLLKHIFSITDPQKWMQRKVFRDSRTTPVTLSGNPINILLAVLMSTGAGTNGDYDWYSAADGLALTSADIDVAGIEAVRDDWYPSDSHYMAFTITEPTKAKEFIEGEILKVLNAYPKITADGKYSIRAFKPPLAAFQEVQSISEADIFGMPSVDYNLDSLINECEIHYDHDGSDFQTIEYFIDSTSIAARGPGKKIHTIKSKGLFSSHATKSIAGRALDVATRRAMAVFTRYAIPPVKFSFSTLFSKWLSEAGDIIPFTHTLIPDTINGGRGIAAERVEVVSREPNWRDGKVKFELLNTGYDRSIYGACSPTMTVTAGTDSTSFAVSLADAAKWANFTAPEAAITNRAGTVQAEPITILTVNAATGAITSDDIGATPAAGWIVQFPDYDNCTDEQKRYGVAADAALTIGTDADPAHICA